MSEDKVIIKNSSYEIYLNDKWSKYNNTFVKGNAFIGGKLLSGADLAEYMDSINEVQRYKEINGYFGCIKGKEDNVEIVTDRIRSCPVFYSLKDDRFYISDDPYELKERFNFNEDNEIAKKELLLSGFITGKETLSKDIYQVEAAQVLNFKNGKLNEDKYYRLLGKHDLNYDKNTFVKNHEKVLNNIFERLIEYANGRTIIIPLSGGYDSRLICIMLKKLNYTNIITFTYGAKDNPECIVSKDVAEKLGLKWIFIQYTDENSYNWYNSQEYKQYQRYADNLSSICCDRDWPAVLEMKKQGLIPDNAIYVPGHSADSLAGSSLQLDWFNKKIDDNEFVSRVLNINYVMWNWKGKEGELLSILKNRILNTSEINNKQLSGSKLDYYEKWVWQEKYIKYFINSVKTYEFFGYDWWMPFWDNEFIDFWMSICNNHRKEEKLYAYHVAKLYCETANISFKEALVRNNTLYQANSFKTILKKTIKKSPFEPIVRRMLSLIKPKKENKFYFRFEDLNNDWEKSFGRLNTELYKELLPYMVGRSSCKTLQRLGYINFNDNYASEDTINMLKNMRG